MDIDQGIARVRVASLAGVDKDRQMTIHEAEMPSIPLEALVSWFGQASRD